MDDEQLVLPGEVDDALHEGEVDRRRRRVVREREDDDARLRLGALPGLLEVREQILVGSHRHARHGRPGEDRRVDVDRVARARHERRVARLEEHPHQVREAFLGADRVQDLRVGVEIDAELALVQRCRGEAKVRDALRGRVAVVARVVRSLGELLDGEIGRGEIGVAEAEVDDVVAATAKLERELADDGERRTAAGCRRGESPSDFSLVRRRGATRACDASAPRRAPARELRCQPQRPRRR